MNAMLIKVMVPVIVGPLSYFLMQWLKSVSGKVDALPPLPKRAIVLVLVSVITELAAISGIGSDCDGSSLSACLATLDQDALKAAVGAALAFGIHAVRKPTK